MKIHKHLLVDGTIRNPISDPEVINAWLAELVDKVDMEIFMEPRSKYCDDPTNAGTTGVVVITTSHASIHIWNDGDPAFFRADLYSCKEFDPQVVLAHFAVFDPIELDYSLIDRTQHPHTICKQGKIFYD